MAGGHDIAVINGWLRRNLDEEPESEEREEGGSSVTKVPRALLDEK